MATKATVTRTVWGWEVRRGDRLWFVRSEAYARKIAQLLDDGWDVPAVI